MCARTAAVIILNVTPGHVGVTFGPGKTFLSCATPGVCSHLTHDNRFGEKPRAMSQRPCSGPDNRSSRDDDSFNAIARFFFFVHFQKQVTNVSTNCIITTVTLRNVAMHIYILYSLRLLDELCTVRNLIRPKQWPINKISAIRPDRRIVLSKNYRETPRPDRCEKSYFFFENTGTDQTERLSDRTNINVRTDLIRRNYFIFHTTNTYLPKEVGRYHFL